MLHEESPQPCHIALSKLMQSIADQSMALILSSLEQSQFNMLGWLRRKRKLLEKQKEGKARMRRVGSVDVPQDVFHSLMRT